MVQDNHYFLLHQGANLLSIDVSLTSGLYIVKVDDKTEKVIIK